MLLGVIRGAKVDTFQFYVLSFTTGSLRVMDNPALDSLACFRRIRAIAPTSSINSSYALIVSGD